MCWFTNLDAGVADREAAHEGGQRFRCEWMAKVEALGVGAAQHAKGLGLFLAFPPLGDHIQRQPPAQFHHARNDCAVAVLSADGLHEAAVDLDGVHREVLHPGKR